MRASRAITVNKPVEEVYAYWRDLANLPRFMSHLKSVETLDEGRSKWTVRAPGRDVSWEARIIEERPGELIAWSSVEGSGIENAGSVRFVPAPGDRGTEVRVQLQYDAPGGAIGANLAKLFGQEPNQQLRDDMMRLKQVLETGEVMRSDGSQVGLNAFQQVKQRPAQPAGNEETN